MSAALPSTAAVVPVFNPEPGLAALCAALCAAFPVVIVVNDGSVENVADFAKLPSAVVRVNHPVNRGKGRAIKTALSWLMEHRPDIQTAVFVDGDGQHRIEDVQSVAAHAGAHSCVTFGVRNFHGKDVPFRSWWGNAWTAWEVRLAFGFRLDDTQTGLRAIPSRLFASLLSLPGERFEYEARIFRLLRRLHEPLEQVPIRTVYVAGNRASHFRPLRDTLLTQAALFFDF